MRYRTFGRTGWQVAEVGYGMWGMAGWTGSDDEESLRVARPGDRARLQLLRHGLGLRRRAQRAAARRRRCSAIPARGSTSRPRSRRRTASGRRGRSTRSTTSSLPTTSASTPRRACEPRRLDARPAAVPRVDRRVGGRRSLAARGRARSRTRGWSARSASASTAGSRPTSCARSRPGSSTPCRSSTTSSTRAPRTSCSRTARSTIAVIARVPFDEGSLTGTLTATRRGRAGTSATSTSSPRTCGDAGARRAAARRRARRA